MELNNIKERTGKLSSKSKLSIEEVTYFVYNNFVAVVKIL